VRPRYVAIIGSAAQKWQYWQQWRKSQRCAMLGAMANTHATPSVRVPATRDTVADEQPREVRVMPKDVADAALARVVSEHRELIEELAKR
jgi:hypothetical protein